MLYLAEKTLEWDINDIEQTVEVRILAEHPYFADHKVKDYAVLPGVVYLELMQLACQKLTRQDRTFDISDCVWLRPIMSTNGEAVSVYLNCNRNDKAPNVFEVKVFFQGQLVAFATLSPSKDKRMDLSENTSVGLAVRDKIILQTQCHVTQQELYEVFSKTNLHYGKTFRRIGYAQLHGQSALGWLSNNDGTHLHWANIMDCAFQVVMAVSIDAPQISLMPYSLGRCVMHYPLTNEALGSVFVLTEKHNAFRSSLTIFDPDYNPMISVFDLGVRSANF